MENASLADTLWWVNFIGIKRHGCVLELLRDQRPEPVAPSSGGPITSQWVIDCIKSNYIY
jgi:hypothetical protein